MKNLKTIAIALFVAAAGISVNAQTKKIDVKASTIKWVGKKVTGEHSGTVNFKDGAVVFKGKKLTGGSFTVDMTSLTSTDLTGEYQGKLNGHLKADDFFAVDKNPEASFTVTEVKPGATDQDVVVSGNLVIKGISNNITFEDKVIEATEAAIKATANSFAVKSLPRCCGSNS